MAAPITTCAAAGKHRGVRNGEVQSGNFKSEKCDVDKMFFSAVHKWTEHFGNSKRKKNFFFTKFRNHRNAAVKSEIESAICWEFVLFSIQRLKSMYFWDIFFSKRAATPKGVRGFDEKIFLKCWILDFDVIIAFFYCTILSFLIRQYVHDVNFVC